MYRKFNERLLYLRSNGKSGGMQMIYLVEDDESIRELVVYTLKSQDLDAKGFA